ncbi:MAG: hypothetical protein GY821_11710, partial [Gammaproteobacteria bacterium]|nr:hypothetical protein [Gammaproteobacteria bacterium]
MFSYDHDLEEFVAIGLGTVNGDGTLIESNPGVGVIKAGWHGGSPPGGDGCAAGPSSCGNSCEEPRGGCEAECVVVADRPLEVQVEGNCQDETCGGSIVVNDDDKPADQCKFCLSGDVLDIDLRGVEIFHESDGSPKDAIVQIPIIVLSATLNAIGCDNAVYEWNFGNGDTESSTTPDSRTYIYSANGETTYGIFTVTLTVRCGDCDLEISDSLTVRVGGVDIYEVNTPSDTASPPGDNSFISTDTIELKARLLSDEVNSN